MEFDIKKVRNIAYDVVDTIEVPEDRMGVHVTYEKNSYSEDVQVYFYAIEGEGSFVLNFTTGLRGHSYSPIGTNEFVHDVPYGRMIELLKEQCEKWGVMINEYF